MRIQLAQIESARSVLRSHFSPTPLAPATSLGAADGLVFLKLETGLPTGSFKVRGAVYALSVRLRTGAPEKARDFGEAAGAGGCNRAIREVIAASTGNHGAAVAYAAGLFKIPATIFLPQRANVVKVQRIRDLGARIVEAGPDLAAAIDAAYDYERSTGAVFLHDACDPDIPAGAGTIGLEILGQLPSVAAIYVPMGDTALIRGVASAVKQVNPAIRIVGAVAERAPAYYLSWRNRSAVDTAGADTIADGLAVRRALPSNVGDICELVDDVQLVSEGEMTAAIRQLSFAERVTAEPAAAAATAARLKDQDRRSPSVVLVTGANLAVDLRHLIDRSATRR